MSGPVYPYRDRSLDSWWWNGLRPRAVTADGFLGDGAVLDDFDTTELRAKHEKRKAESEWPGPMWGDFDADARIIRGKP